MNEKSSKTEQETSEQLPEKVEDTTTENTVDENPELSVKADSKKTKSKKKEKNKPVKEKQTGAKLALLSLMLAVIAIGVTGYEFVSLQNQQSKTAKLSSSQSNFVSRIDTLEQNLQSTKNALNQETQSRKNAEAEFGALKTAMEALASKLGRTSNEWRLAEIEYLLTIANHRLSLFRDRVTAIAIFENADQRIKALGDPALFKIRKSIKEELLALRAVQEPDLTGMALSLGSLAAEVERLPLVDKERVEVATGQIKDQAPESWQDIPAAVWKDIKSLVVVRRHQQPTEPLLPPSESWFLVQNLRLKLEQAQLSLLRRDTALFHQHLKEANTWISTFFNDESPGVINALEKISILAKVELQPASPEVSGSLRQLRNLLAERGVKIGATIGKQEGKQ